MFRKVRQLVLALGLVAVGTAHAVPIVGTSEITGSGQAGSVGYFNFTVTGAGIFDIFTMGPTIDPDLFLFDAGNFVANGEIASNDDDCPSSICGPAGSFSNSLITISLVLGDYIAAVGDYNLTSAEAVSGINNSDSFGPLTGTVTITVAGNANDGGGANAVSTVPEPTSLALLGAGILAGGLIRRRRKS